MIFRHIGSAIDFHIKWLCMQVFELSSLIHPSTSRTKQSRMSFFVRYSRDTFSSCRFPPWKWLSFVGASWWSTWLAIEWLFNLPNEFYQHDRTRFSIDHVHQLIHFFPFNCCHCDECVFAGQNVFLGPTIHVLRPECFVESHYLHLIHVVCCCFQMRFQKKH